MTLACQVALAALLIGLVARGRWRLAYVFGPYIAAALAGNALRYYWPDRFFVPEFFMLKQGIYDVLKIALALEIGWRVFAPFRGALRTARLLTMLLLVGAAGAFALTNPGPQGGSDPWYLLALGWVHPRVLLVATWLMITILGAARYYLVPIHPFHLGILTAFAAYLGIDGTLAAMVGTFGWAAQPFYNEIGTVAYLALVVRWVWLAWGPEPKAVADYRAVLAMVARFA